MLASTDGRCYAGPMRIAHLALGALFVVACGDDDTRPPADTHVDADAADTLADTTEDTTDTAADILEDSADTADSLADTDAADAADADVPTDVDEHGFQIRVPQIRTVPTEDFEGHIRAVDQRDIDHVCRLGRDGVETFLYVRAEPVRCRDFGGCEYDVTGAFTTTASARNAPLTGVGYDYGGNHHNDFITLPSSEGTLKIYHSSFGFGWRACHPPDCVQVLDGDNTVIDDGCTTERTRPAPCVLIAEDGSEPPITDDFVLCPGDPNAP